ncbi:MAG: HPr family phosphocarrier protein [Chloroflexota bacterium]
MISVELEIRNPSGLHARPAAMFVRTAGAQQAAILVRNVSLGSAEVNGKSLLAVMGLGVSHGQCIAVTADGEDEEAAIEAIRGAVDGGLGETVEGTAGGEPEPT